MKVDFEFLRKVEIFADFYNRELTDVSQLFKKLSYKCNEIIFSETDTGNYMCNVKQGRVKVSRVLPSRKETTWSFMEEGKFFGELFLIDVGTIPVALIAVTATTIFFYRSSKFRAFSTI